MPERKLIELDCMSECIAVDRTFAYDLLIALSELHARHCQHIADCGDMGESTKAATLLESIAHLYNDVEVVAAKFDDREPNELEI